MFALLVLLNYS